MAGPHRSSSPSSSGEPSLRRLGVGSSGGGDRPLRAQLVVVGVIALVIVAVPLYLVRRPSGGDKNGAASASASAASAMASAATAPSALLPKPPERLKLGAPQRVRCGASASGGNEGNLCDSLPSFEQALVTAIQSSLDCAPKVNSEGSINYVLNVDFGAKKLHVFPGASGTWRGKQARRATQCVKKALPLPDWTTVAHQYRHYTIAILATYRPATALRDPTAPPVFE